MFVWPNSAPDSLTPNHWKLPELVELADALLATVVDAAAEVDDAATLVTAAEEE